MQDKETEEWCATAVTLPAGILDYGSIVSTLINAKYPPDTMQAVTNNFLEDYGNLISELISGDSDNDRIREIASTLSDGGAQQHLLSFTQMQDFRGYAKDTAKAIVKALEDAEKQTGNE